MTVERLRNHLTAGGAQIRKDDIVRALRDLNERGQVQIGAARKWHMRRTSIMPVSHSGGSSPVLTNRDLPAIPCSAFLGQPSNPEEVIPEGRLTPDLKLLKRLLPYYQEALRAGDGGSPVEVLPLHGETFVLLRPDQPWWPTTGHGRTIRVPLSRLPDGFKPQLAKNQGRKLLLGYPVHVVNPRSEDSQPFLRPVSTFRCNFNVSDSHLEIHVPSMPPAIVQDWLRDQKKYGGWNVANLKSWLLLEDDQAGVEDADDVESPELVEIPTFTNRLNIAAGRSVRQRLVPDAIAPTIPSSPETGYFNAIALMADRGTKFTRSAINDYDVLQSRSDDQFALTALDKLFGGYGHRSSPPPVLHPFPMGESQLLAAKAALTGPLTVITGPPGTGKSQVIAAIMLSAVAAGKSVLFAARQHRALDAVAERLHALTGDRVILIRANEAEGAGGFRFTDALKALLTRVGDPESARLFSGGFDKVTELDRKRWALLEQWQALKVESAAAGEVLEKIEASERRLQELEADTRHPKPDVTIGTWERVLRCILGKLWGKPGPIAFGRSWEQREIRKKLQGLRSQLAATETRIADFRQSLGGNNDTPVDLSRTIEEETANIIEPLLDRLEDISEEARQTLTDIVGDASLRGSASLTGPAREIVLKHFPLWAVTTLAAGSRIPAEPGMFDYVIFDEAAQTDIASAVPLLFRARAAVIVGDPMQLSMISKLDAKEERDLLVRHDLMREGIGRYAQGRTTLFDLASAYAGQARYMLTEHYRCHPQIASFFNEAFYGRKLTALTDVSRLRVPSGFRPGLHWTDVTGPVMARTGAATGSASSQAEAQAIVDQLKDLIAQNFEGTIGVVTFFDFQARTINELAAKQIGAAKLDKHSVRVFTANKFQGDERDVMLLSLCLGPGMPSGARGFIEKDRRLLNVAVSRARAVCHVFGNLDYASSCGIPHVELLARKVRQASVRPEEDAADDRFESPWERKLHDSLVQRGLSPIPQHPVGGRFLDLALMDETRDPPVRIDVEVDGVAFHMGDDGHRLPTDLWRDHQLRALGWKVLRFWVYELRDEMEKCVDRIEAEFRG